MRVSGASRGEALGAGPVLVTGVRGAALATHPSQYAPSATSETPTRRNADPPTLRNADPPIRRPIGHLPSPPGFAGTRPPRTFLPRIVPSIVPWIVPGS